MHGNIGPAVSHGDLFIYAGETGLIGPEWSLNEPNTCILAEENIGWLAEASIGLTGHGLVPGKAYGGSTVQFQGKY